MDIEDLFAKWKDLDPTEFEDLKHRLQSVCKDARRIAQDFPPPITHLSIDQLALLTDRLTEHYQQARRAHQAFQLGDSVRVNSSTGWPHLWAHGHIGQITVVLAEIDYYEVNLGGRFIDISAEELELVNHDDLSVITMPSS